METTSVFVTGSTGNVGSEVVRALLANHVPERAADRVPARARALFGDAVEAVRFDYRDRSTFAAVAGCGTLFLLRPPAVADVKTTLLPFIDQARQRGVNHIVFLSVDKATGAVLPSDTPGSIVEAFISGTQPGAGGFARPQ